jgi:hypothetical protein
VQNKNIKPYNKNGKAHGYWELYWSDTMWYKCFYVNWESYGYLESYLNTGELNDKIYYAR